MADKPYNPFEQGDPIPFRHWCTEAKDKVLQWKDGKAEGYSTGFPSLDKYFRLVDGELVTVAGRPSMGKTILGVQMAELAARNLRRTGEQGRVVIFSAEMTGWSLVHRIAGAAAGVEVHRLRMGKGKADDYERLTEAIDRIRDLPIWIDDSSAPTTDAMFEKLATLQKTAPIRLMLFDFMELGGNRGQTEEQRISQIAIALKDIAKSLEIPVIAISQINRGVESRGNKMPTLADLRYSGQIEQISDVVCFIMRPQYYVERGQHVEVADDSDRHGVAYISIAKNRHGPPANVKMHFNSALGKFGELETARTL